MPNTQLKSILSDRVDAPIYMPFRGGMDTRRERPLLAFGSYSMVQNLRARHPGFVKRMGQAKLHTTADGTNKVMTLYQYVAGARDERHFFAQMSDGDVLEATSAPPTVTTGIFGNESFNGSASPKPASWGMVDDIMLFSNGVDQHQLYPGDSTNVRKFIHFVGASATQVMPDGGTDYSVEVEDENASTVAVLDSMGDLTNDYHAVYIKTPVKAKSLTWTVTAANGGTATGRIHYWNGAWTDTSMTDGTLEGASTLAKTGTMSWTPAADEIPHYLFGESGFWYRFTLADGHSLDAEVEISTVTFNANWQSLVNVWDGVPFDTVEIQHYDASADVYKTYASESVELDSMAPAGVETDYVYIASTDKICGIYVDVGEKPNTTAATTVSAVHYWDGNSWETCSNLTDGTNGISNTGWIVFDREAAQPRQFNSSQYQAYWYRFIVDQTFNDDVDVGIQVMPYFDINEMGRIGNCNSVWKDRAVYSFDQAPHYIYVSVTGEPMILNGSDFWYGRAGDGRKNKITCMKNFYSELMVWQEEKGIDGGCVTLFEGDSPSNFDKFILSTNLGTFNAKSAVVIDGVLTSTRTDEKVKTVAYFLSRNGVFVTDGKTIESISDAIQNYFDPTDSNCVRTGYEDEHWIAYDTTYNVLRVGLVTGSSATVPNTFLVYDLVDKTWGFDDLVQELSCVAEVEAASGDVTILQVGGGVDDGFVYRLNTGNDDVTTAIDGYVIIDLSYKNMVMFLREMILRMKTQSEGNVEITIYNNGVESTSFYLDMTAANEDDLSRRHRFNLNEIGDHLSVKIRNNSKTQSMYLEDMGLYCYAHEER